MTTTFSLKQLRNVLSLLTLAALGSTAFADMQHVRLEQQFGLNGALPVVLTVLEQNSNIPKLTSSDFLEVENKVLANYRFATYLQLFQGTPIKGAMIRTWESRETGHLVLLEANIDDGASAFQRSSALAQSRFLSGRRVLSGDDRALASKAIAHSSDSKIAKLTSGNQWNGADLERVIKVSGKRGVHTLTFSQFTGQLKSNTYIEYPQDDVVAQVFPIYEESEKAHIMQHRIPVILKNILPFRKDTSVDPYAALRARTFIDAKMDDIKAATADGEAQGYWSMSSLKVLIASIQKNLVSVPNTYENGGVYLDGKYATVSIHPDAANMSGVTVPLKASEQVFFNWAPIGDGTENAMTLTTPFKSQPLLTESSALERPARRLPDHDPASYLNDGFDEIQVYYAIDTLMESLHSMGFTDPELSERPFHAFLYNPDIEMRDNAFYTDDTINFTTYSADAQNYARDNSTIWHELGHGIMDRLMGDRITLADSGGLSEGMADFIAQLIIQDKTDGKPFDGSEDLRIINNTGFNLTNESHDDGEAYGGSMRDLMVLAVAKEGHAGLAKVTDITLDAMRLARNHPALTANDWFESILFADRLGHKGVRAPGEMSPLIMQALNHRNYRFDHGTPANLKVVSEDGELTNLTKGSRYKPYVHVLKPGETASHEIQISLSSSDTYKFKYPVTIEVTFNGGPLQGAVKWEEEAAGPKTFVLNSESDVAKLKLTALSGCDFVNREDGSCQDFAYILVKNDGETRPVAKKRFYMRISAAGGTAAQTRR